MSQDDKMGFQKVLDELIKVCNEAHGNVTCMKDDVRPKDSVSNVGSERSRRSR